MSDRLPDFIDPLRLAEQNLTLNGRVDLQRLSRLQESLSSREGEVDIALEFGTDEQGVRFVSGTVDADLQMLCQRCMEPMTQAVHAKIALGLVRGEAEAERLPSGYEPLQLDSDRLYLADLIEDELILALPISPMHEQPACTPWRQDRSGEEQAEKASPFSILAGLKSRADTDE